MKYINEIALTDFPVLITGESGTGKTRLGRTIERIRNTQLGTKNFIHLNIASLSPELFESELFGHCKGAFTGATENKVGYAERVSDGVLFLDEIGELPLEQQVKLLQFIEERRYYSVGSTSLKVFNGKLVMATNKDLVKLVKVGKFRLDLYERIKYFQFKLPSFHELNMFERRSIVSELINETVDPERLSTNLINFLVNSKWQGNIRELKNLLNFLAVIYTGINRQLDVKDLPNLNERQEREAHYVYPLNYYEALADFESSFFEYALMANNGRVNRTCETIGISKSTFVAKCKKYGISSHLIKYKCLKIIA